MFCIDMMYVEPYKRVEGLGLMFALQITEKHHA